MKKKLDWIKEWINKADKDLNVAERFLNDENMADVVCFHAQQAARILNRQRYFEIERRCCETFPLYSGNKISRI